MKFSTLAIAAFAAITEAKNCVNSTVPVTISARNGMFNISIPHNQFEVTSFILANAQQGANYTNKALGGYSTVAGTYNISTQFCTPEGGLQDNTILQILTHGIGFDKTYWDLSFANFNYSYVDVALKANYATFSFDRLGIANSSHGGPLNEIQAPLEVAALVELTRQLRAGSFPGISHCFQKVVHVGHSFGSVQTYTLANSYPTLTDGIVLTGFSLNGSFLGQFLAAGDFEQANKFSPERFGNLSSRPLPDGYLSTGSPAADQFQFFYYPYFNTSLFEVAEKTKQPVTVGELLTTAASSMTNQFAGPVLIVTGSNDVPFCGGNCTATGNASLASIPAAAASAFKNVAKSNFTAYVQPHTGHGINLHYNSTGAYQVILNFLSARGLST